MNDRDIKIKCLELAKQNSSLVTESFQYTVGQEKVQQKTILELAKDYYQWIIEA